jgi:hypothetical protein
MARLAGLAGLLLALGLAAGGARAVPRAATGPRQFAETLRIDAAGDLGPVTLRHGFLHGLDGTAGYDEAKVAALRPRNWRLAKAQSYQFAAALDPRITYELAAPFAWARGGFPAVSPWEDWAEWEGYVRTRVSQILAAFPEDRPAFWDIWNEPDHPHFWHGSQDQLLELFARTVTAVREVDASARFVGPSVAWYRRGGPGVADVVAFLDQLDARYGLRLDAVAWHENHTATPDVIVANARSIRQDLAARFGPDYRPELHVNEHLGTEVHSSPGWNVGHLYYLEQARIDAWMRACWDVTSPAPAGGVVRWNDCWAGLNGLFMADGLTEQPAYWVLLAYAETEGETRLPVTSSTHTTTALASRDEASRRIRLLVGRHGGSARSALRLQLAGWPWPGPVIARAARIPSFAGFRANPSAAVPWPAGPVPELTRRLVPSATAELSLDLSAVDEGEAWLVELVPAPRIWLPAVAGGG